MQLIETTKTVSFDTGSFATASCIRCKRQVPGKEIESDIQAQRVAMCKTCVPKAKGLQPFMKVRFYMSRF